MASNVLKNSEIITLNVGGKLFSTTYQTLTWIPNTYFSNLLNPSFKEKNYSEEMIFIDRDPKIFEYVLNYMRTRQIPSKSLARMREFLCEAIFFNIQPLIAKLSACIDLNQPKCGSIYFSGFAVQDGLRFPNKVTDQSSTTDLSISTDRHNISMISYADLNQTEPIILIAGHNNYVAVSSLITVTVFLLVKVVVWDFLYATPPITRGNIQKLTLNVKVSPNTLGKLLSFSTENEIFIYNISKREMIEFVGKFCMNSIVSYLFFTTSHLVALGGNGQIVCWNSFKRSWRQQETYPISCCDKSQNLVIIGCTNGDIKSVDLEKFPVRLRDNDLLLSHIFSDSRVDSITAISLYTHIATTDVSKGGIWLEIAFGTSHGSIYIIGHHPETGGTTIRIFQTLHVHSHPILRVVLTEKYLISACEDNFHIKTWSITRFRGMLSTQPGPNILSSYSIVSFEEASNTRSRGCSKGPYGDGDGSFFFIEQINPCDTSLKLISATTGECLCNIHSADGSIITSYNINDCDALSNKGSRPYLHFFTGHKNGTVQIWDISLMIDEKNNLRYRYENLPEVKKEELIRYTNPSGALYDKFGSIDVINHKMISGSDNFEVASFH